MGRIFIITDGLEQFMDQEVFHGRTNMSTIILLS